MSDETQGGEKSDPRCPYKYLRCPALAERDAEIERLGEDDWRWAAAQDTSGTAAREWLNDFTSVPVHEVIERLGYAKCAAEARVAELEQIHAEVMLEGEAASVRRLERERDAACEAVGAMGAAATEAEDRMYGRFRQAEIERDEARAKLARADRLAEACRGIGVGNLNDVVQEIREALAAYEAGEESTDG